MPIRIAQYLWWVPLTLAAVLFLGFSITANPDYGRVTLIALPLGMIAAIIGIVLALIEINHNRRSGTEEQKRFGRGVVTIALLLSNFPAFILLIWLATGLAQEPAKQSLLGPERYLVAEHFRTTDPDDPLAMIDGVRLRLAISLSRKLSSTTVFIGHCQQGITLMWPKDKTLLIECKQAGKISLRKEKYKRYQIIYRTH